MAIDKCFYRIFDAFSQKIFEFFEHIEQYKQELENLIFWNSHMLPKSKPVFLLSIALKLRL